MKQFIGVTTLACVLCAAPLTAQTPAPGTQTKPKGSGTGPATPGGTKAPSGSPAASKTGADTTFIKTVAMDGMAEVEHGRLAAGSATDPEVKQFAQRMVDDHGKAGGELKGLASQKNVPVPAELDAKHKAMQDKLSKLKGAAFDQAYMAHMATAHQQAVALFAKEAKGGTDPEVKAWAAKTLPTVQEHLKMARALNTKVGKGARGAGPAK